MDEILLASLPPPPCTVPDLERTHFMTNPEGFRTLDPPCTRSWMMASARSGIACS